VINRRQARYILHNVNEVSRILQSGLGREPFTDVSVARGGDAADDSRASLQLMSFCRRLTSIVYRYCTQCIPVIIAAFVVQFYCFSLLSCNICLIVSSIVSNSRIVRRPNTCH